MINANNITFKVCLDSGNTLNLPAMSKVFQKKLTDSEQIPRQSRLRRTNIKITSVDSSLISVEGKLNHPLLFKDLTNSIILSFGSFIVIKGLSNSMNTRKSVF